MSLAGITCQSHGVLNDGTENCFGRTAPDNRNVETRSSSRLKHLQNRWLVFQLLVAEMQIGIDLEESPRQRNVVGQWSIAGQEEMCGIGRSNKCQRGV